MIYIIIEQIGITEKEYLEGMIEHHAMAINMSRKLLLRQNISVETRQLAHNIINSQQEEINQMDNMIKKMQKDR